MCASAELQAAVCGVCHCALRCCVSSPHTHALAHKPQRQAAASDDKPAASRKRAAAEPAAAAKSPKKPAAAAAKKPAAAKASTSSGKAGKLNVGDKLPDFEVENDEGVLVKSADLVADAGAVIFTYPRANTPGCTKQACGFRCVFWFFCARFLQRVRACVLCTHDSDACNPHTQPHTPTHPTPNNRARNRDNYDLLKSKGYQVFGISADKPKSQANWRAKYSFPYNLLCDPERGALKALGFTAGDKISRSHIIVGKGGAVLDVQCVFLDGA
jgi:peroxiredoxin Q/BCP